MKIMKFAENRRELVGKYILFQCALGLVIFADLTSLTYGYCNELNVKDAQYQEGINGNYYLMYNTANNQPVWLQATTVNGYYVTTYYYMWYAVNVPAMLNNSTLTLVNGWVIGTSPFVSGSSVVYGILAYNTQPMGTQPNDLPSTWYEFNGNQNMYVLDSDLEVDCDNSLDGWEIFGIVIGSICGFLLLLSIVACCCAKCKEKKRRTNPSAVVYSTRARGPRGAAACTVVTTTVPMGQPAPFTDPVYIINPPAYDNNLPPAYETIAQNTAVGLPQAIVDPNGVVNPGLENKF